MEKFSKWRDASTGIQPFLPPKPDASDDAVVFLNFYLVDLHLFVGQKHPDRAKVLCVGPCAGRGAARAGDGRVAVAAGVSRACIDRNYDGASNSRLTKGGKRFRYPYPRLGGSCATMSARWAAGSSSGCSASGGSRRKRSRPKWGKRRMLYSYLLCFFNKQARGNGRERCARRRTEERRRHRGQLELVR